MLNMFQANIIFKRKYEYISRALHYVYIYTRYNESQIRLYRDAFIIFIIIYSVHIQNNKCLNENEYKITPRAV